METFRAAEPTILEKAAERHKARTSEEIERIRKAWETRKEAISLGDSVLSDLDGISDVDTTELRNQLDTAHYAQALEEARRLQEIVDRLKNLEFVDGGLALAKQYGYEAITGVEAAVKAKLEALSSLSLEKQKSKLEFEVYQYFGGNMNGCQQKYNTWKVAQNAYAKQLKIVSDKLWWQDVKAKLRAAISSGNVNGFVGKEVVDHGFVSCGTAKGTGFSGTTLNIYCPKGTKMIYAEPFSRFNGDSCSSWNLWNGTEKYSFGHEFETIIQRGTKFRVTKAYVEYGHLYLDVEVIAQI